jgi:drug/metabolite transporter (DMT)-like permease
MRSIAEMYVAVASTMLGFMVAALAILTAVVDRRLVINLRKTGHYQRLLREIYCACVGFLCTLVMALLCLFIQGGSLHASIAIASSALAVALVLLVSSGRKFARVMEYLAE